MRNQQTSNQIGETIKPKGKQIRIYKVIEDVENNTQKSKDLNNSDSQLKEIKPFSKEQINQQQFEYQTEKPKGKQIIEASDDDNNDSEINSLEPQNQQMKQDQLQSQIQPQSNQNHKIVIIKEQQILEQEKEKDSAYQKEIEIENKSKLSQLQLNYDEAEYYNVDGQNLYLKKFTEYCEQSMNLKDILKDLIELQQQIKECDFETTQITTKINLKINQIQLQTNARKRIKYDVDEFQKFQPQNIYLFKIKKDNTILQHAFIIIMKGGDEQYLNDKKNKFYKNFENGYFSFYLEFPEDYPFSTPTFRSLLPIKHPHIYPDNRVCIPLIDCHSIVQNYSILNLLKSQYDILHNQPNQNSIANYDVFEQYDEEIVKLQCQFLSEHNLIYKKWKIFQQIEEYKGYQKGSSVFIIDL